MNRRDFLTKLALGFFNLTLFNQALAAKRTIPLKNHWLPKIQADSFGFLAIGDMGTGWKTQYNLIKQMSQNPVQDYPGLILLGDLLYPSAQASKLEPNLIKPFAPLFQKNLRFYPVWGNHDWLEQKAIHLKQYFEAPDYYTFSIGPASFWMLNSNQFDQKQATWLNNNLRFSKAPWKIVCLHHSPYSSGTVHYSNQKLIQELVPILHNNKVDLCLSGHNHLYERTAAIDGVVYITSGGGSASLHKFAPSANYPRAMVKSLHHYLRVKGNNNHLLVEAIDLKAKVFDQTILRKI